MLSVLFLGLAGALQISNAPAISPDDLPHDKAATQEKYIGTQTQTPRFESSSKCSALFGNEKARAKNARQRKKKFVGVFQRRNGREVLHSVNRWQEISTLRMPHIQYRGTVLRDGKRRAHLSVKHPACGNKRRDFLLTTDDALGKHARVMAVLNDGILVEHGKALTRLSSQKSKDDLRLIWRSPFLLSVSGGAAQRPTSAPASGLKPPKLPGSTLSKSAIKARDAARGTQLTTSGVKKKKPKKKPSIR